MQLSVIIVSYNVRFFLDQAIASVLESDCNFEYEIIVVDNGSTDDSVEWVKNNYPTVRIFNLNENLGFAKANNFAAKRAKGDCILLLNPDTIVQSDSLQSCYNFLSAREQVGAVGLRMYDGQGKYLPESKRGFPSPWTSFCKITGLNELFPNSKLFNYYYLGHKSSDVDQKVDVLTGAFMMLRRDRYIELGGLDEDFFMYGEDIDLCFRLRENGFQNYYLASSSIIHFKGESTSKRSLQYIKTFYSAMSIYTGKHYNRHILALMSLFIQGAIYARAGLAIVYQKVRNHRSFIGHFLFILLGLFLGHFITHSEFYLDYRFFIPPVLVAGISRFLGMKDDRWNWWTQLASWGGSTVILIPMILASNSPLWPVSVILGLLYFFIQLLSQPKPVFLPRLQNNHYAVALVSESSLSKVKELLDQLPGHNRIQELLRMNSVKDTQTSQVPDSEFILDPSFLSWSDIVKSIITYGNEKINRILSADLDCLITSRSKNESAILITKAYLEEKRWEPLKRKRSRHEFAFSLFILLLIPISLLISGRKGLQKALSVVFRGDSWFPSWKKPLSDRGEVVTPTDRQNFIARRQYFFYTYQQSLWSDFVRRKA